MNVNLDILDDIRIAAPCPAAWDDMHGNDRARHCNLCDKRVYNIAEMTRREAVELITGDQQSLCLRIWRRQDGAVLTSDCPVGQRLRRRTRKWVAAVAGFLGIATTASGGCSFVVGAQFCDDPQKQSRDADRSGAMIGEAPTIRDTASNTDAQQRAPGKPQRMIDKSTNRN